LIEHELQLIERLDYALLPDRTRHRAFARARGILCQDAAPPPILSSAIARYHCSRSGAVDVLFERFISAARNEPPDIDVDFEHERREEVIQYVYEKYGRDRAGLAHGDMLPLALGDREVGKALGLSVDVVAALAGIVWAGATTDRRP